jgi:hypothetical protein
VPRIDGEKQVASSENHNKGSLRMSVAPSGPVSAAVPSVDLFSMMGISLVFPPDGDPVGSAPPDLSWFFRKLGVGILRCVWLAF